MKCERKKREKEGKHVRVENDAMKSMRRQCIPGTEREVPAVSAALSIREAVNGRT